MFGLLHLLPLEMRRVGVALAWLCMCMTGGAAWGQFTDGINVEFGNTRGQYRTFEWQYCEQGLCEVYH